jgi:hypothetical protein
MAPVWRQLRRRLEVSAPETTEWARGELRDVMSLYAVSDFEKVRSFFLRHDQTAPLLLEAYPRLTAAFSGVAQLVLETTDDPDEDAEEELLVSVRTGLPVEEAVRRLDFFDEHWWRGVSARVPVLNFDVD